MLIISSLYTNVNIVVLCHSLSWDGYKLSPALLIHEKNLTVSRSQWASSTGLTAVSKFKPRLPAQWAIGTHRSGLIRMEKSNFPNELTNQKSDSNSKLKLAYRQQRNVQHITFFISNMFYRMQNNFGALNDHIITDFSWVVTMEPAVLRIDILRWPVTSQWPSSRPCNCGVFAISDHTKLILGLCNINEC